MSEQAKGPVDAVLKIEFNDGTFTIKKGHDKVTVDEFELLELMRGSIQLMGQAGHTEFMAIQGALQNFWVMLTPHFTVAAFRAQMLKTDNEKARGAIQNMIDQYEAKMKAKEAAAPAKPETPKDGQDGK